MTLVSIIGDFYSSVAPVFYEFKDKITNHIIISDDSKRDSKLANKFKKGVEDFVKEKKLKIKNYYYSIDEDSFESLNRAKDFILKHSKGEIYINTTDGLSSINTFFSLKMLPHGAKIISYDIYDNEYHVISKESMQKFFVKSSIPIVEHFKLKGVEVIDKNPKQIAEIYKNEIYDLFYKHHNEYRAFKREITTKPKMPSRKDFPNVYKIFDKMNLTNHDISKEVLFQPLTGDMFEFFVYLQVKDLGFDDIEIGLEIEYENVKNEFDLLVSKNNHVHIIECKHKGFTTLNIAELIYKYAALKKIVDDESKAVIVSLVTKYREYFLNRAFANGIALFGFDRNLRQNIREFLLEGRDDGTFFTKYIKDHSFK